MTDECPQFRSSKQQFVRGGVLPIAERMSGRATRTVRARRANRPSTRGGMGTPRTSAPTAGALARMRCGVGTGDRSLDAATVVHH
ncbi:hypothetical protein [Haladaptatus caseinilyticus]|uniref:hypothetical protein n=1 Tax=Haladaptatus caseinilyticus TaxID=2993314 RepID=UPI00224B8109|nr:hypothetical protein [Haladaptatus caseinilyticus]